MMVEPRPLVDKTNLVAAIRYCSDAIERGCHFATRLKGGNIRPSRLTRVFQDVHPARRAGTCEAASPSAKDCVAATFTAGCSYVGKKLGMVANTRIPGNLSTSSRRLKVGLS